MVGGKGEGDSSGRELVAGRRASLVGVLRGNETLLIQPACRGTEQAALVTTVCESHFSMILLHFKCSVCTSS